MFASLQYATVAFKDTRYRIKNAGIELILKDNDVIQHEGKR